MQMSFGLWVALARASPMDPMDNGADRDAQAWLADTAAPAPPV